MTNVKTFTNEYRPARDMTCESSSAEVPFQSQSRRKHLSNISLSVVSIGINLIAVGMLSYALFLISHRSHPHTYSLAESDGNNEFTPLQVMAKLDVNKVPTDANVLLKIKDESTVTVRLYQIKSVQAKRDQKGQEISRTFFLSLSHKLVIQEGTAALYDETGLTVLALYDLNNLAVKTAEENDAKQISKKLRRLFFTKKPHGHGPQPYAYGNYGGYCPYCGMYSYNRGFPFGGGYPYGGMGGFGAGMGGFGRGMGGFGFF